MRADGLVDALFANEEQMFGEVNRLACCALMEDIVAGIRTDLFLNRPVFLRWESYQGNPVFQLVCMSAARADGLGLLIGVREYTWTMDLRHAGLYGPVTTKGGRAQVDRLHRTVNYHLAYLNTLEAAR